MTVSVSSLRRPAASYTPADGSYRAVAAPLWRRGVASGLDWVLAFVAFLLLSIPFGMLQTLGDAVSGPIGDAVVVFAEALALGVIVAYFTHFLSTGSTLGMRAMDIHAFAYGTGRKPHLARALARSLLALGFFLATITAYRLIRGYHGPDGLTDREELLRNATLAVALVALAGHLWKLVDPDGRTLWDRLTGLVVIEDMVPTGMPDRLWTPWGT